MAFSSEVTGKLGIDTSSVPADLNKAKEAFNKFGESVQTKAGEHGAAAGGQLTNALEHRLLGARHLSGALATALGLNIEKISEHIASTLVGGSKEAWEESIKIADESTKVIERLIEVRMNPKQVQDKHAKDLARAIDENAGAGEQTKLGKFGDKVGGAFGDNVKKLGQFFGLVKSDAQILTEKQTASLKVNEADLQVQEEKKQVREAEKKLAEETAAAEYETGNHTQRVAALKKSIAEADALIAGKTLSDLEITNKKIERLHMVNKLKAEELSYTQQQEDKDRQLDKLAVDRTEAMRKRDRDEAELATKKSDQGKLTIGEIAALKPGKSTIGEGSYQPVDTFGLSAEAAAAKEKAAEIERMQAKAERLRTSGDVSGANELFGQIGTKKDELVSSGFAKSTEGDPFKQLQETIHKDNVEVTRILTETQNVLKGKLRNE